MGQEQRQFIRINTRLTAIFKILTTGKVRRALTKDVSGGGVCFVTEGLLEPGTALEIELKLPDRAEPIRFTGEVAWSRPVGGTTKRYANPTAETGVRFVAIDAKDRALVLQYTTLNAPAI